ncbi:CDP-glycerol glycerophosphotransferase family protein [Alkalilimnicola ehrlichii]|uniref:CDP-glycerol glycerophosphotransferase family protein n=1 Tax=Alkalilimnicola ehrlichii TaxID=351052 RepID=UPI003B9E11F7
MLRLAGVLRRRLNKKPIWVIAERPHEARDNGYHFFQYLCEYHPEVLAVYPITNDSPDKSKVARLGKTVRWGGLRHYLYWAIADVTASAHANDAAPVGRLAWQAKSAGRVFHISAYLRHGVTATGLPGFLKGNGYAFDLVTTSAPCETRFLKAHSSHSKAIREVGLCRFDALLDAQRPKKQVLMMPTWRREFRGFLAKYGRNKALRLFFDSDYYRVLNGFINSPGLCELLNRYDHEFVFYLHSGAQEFLGAFESSNPRVTIASPQSYDVQSLLKASRIMVTDYSSVAFDFVYMGKPLVYLLPDTDFFEKHVEAAYFDLERDGFGPVVTTATGAVQALRETLENDASLVTPYADRVSEFFSRRDSHNCERTFEAITTFQKARKGSFGS